ncbi:hypothetical protein NEOLEDRAFT_763368 [Neolentinus lepideus HHB14362 ss-1]|uniref:Stress response protein NST1 n=1 Tax=Neolentinus lepideus HHB14362 ss-1 TaxID=1314782 RepID=A0A165PPF5_9AGAM|nr:hypothetical protein NEOLEDRAFT_763368 [Neolentinus lepideus HHB14362 ss-1]
MAATKQKAKQPVMPGRTIPSSHAPPSSPVPNSPSQTVNGKKKKKKKGKGRNGETDVVASHEEYDYDESPLPELEPAMGSPRTGLSPELESVHLSTTASLSASAAAARLNPADFAQAELVATANELYRRMDADPHGGIPEDDEYWDSLPAHIRNFAQALYAIAQQMVQSGVKNGSTKGAAGYPPGAYPASFDPSIFSDPALNSVMEQVAANAVHSASDQQTQANVVLFDDFGVDEPGYDQEEYFSEDEVDENMDDMDGLDPRVTTHRSQFTLSYDDAHARLNGTNLHHYREVESINSLEDSTKRKKNKKKKKRNSALSPPPVMETIPAVPAPRGPPPAESPTMAVTNPPAPVSASNPMPVARTTAGHPPPSSRAAGKQPMSYSSPAPTTPNPPPSSRTARAASKAPVSAHAYPHNHPHHHPSPPSSNASAPQKPRPPAAGQSTPSAKGKEANKIWSTNSAEERERIKEFWLGLGEDERRNLVKVEKEAVLKKMKEQQKHSCSCAVCGRKRNAIEEELEVLYDAYYDELEQYANYQQRYVSSGGTIPPPPGPGPFPGSVEVDKDGAFIGGPKLPQRIKNSVVPNGRKAVKPPESEFDEDDGDEEEYEEEEEEEYEEEDDDDDDDDDEGDAEDDDDGKVTRGRRNAAPRVKRPNGTKAERDGLFAFGDLTVTGNILTVADDLLKNDGQKFLEMMEQLAERRMQREEEAAGDVEDDSEEEEEDDGDEDDEDDEDEDDEDEEEDEEVMTDEQKMEEGKRMFSIFAARMFEQRVLQAYREKVAQERQLQLLRELEEEEKAAKEKDVKKQSQSQKKKAKKLRRRRKSAAQKARQAALEEEQRKKREEERARREAARKAQEEERARKEEERRKRLREEKDREEREKRLAKEKEEKEKEKEKAEKEARERAAQQQQQRAAAKAANSRPPPSPRNAPVAGSSQPRSPPNNVASKKILNKTAQPPAPLVPPLRQQSQPHQPRPVVVTASQPATPITAQTPHMTPSTPIYSPGGGVIPPQAMSPRVPFTPSTPYGGFVPGPPIQPGPPSLGASALPRTFGNGPTFEASVFGRGLPPPPIAPPSKAVGNSLASPPPSLAPGPSRQPSNPDPGPITRPVAPIARPAASGDNSGSAGSGSPVRRSPSPKGTLGSSALAADDDEVVTAPSRRGVNAPVGQVWGAANTPDGARPPWGSPAAGFGSPRAPGAGAANMLWGGVNPAPPEWHPSATNFFASPFLHHAPSPAPHNGS